MQQDGYVETARAFAKEIYNEKKALRLNSNERVEGISIRDDEDANNRQRKLMYAVSAGETVVLT